VESEASKGGVSWNGGHMASMYIFLSKDHSYKLRIRKMSKEDEHLPNTYLHVFREREGSSRAEKDWDKEEAFF